MTAREYIDEIKLRLNRLGVTMHINDALIMNYVNKARRDVQIATMGVLPERYGSRNLIQINNATIDDDTTNHKYYTTLPIEVRRFILPSNYLDIVSFWLRWEFEGTLNIREARRITKQELHNVKSHCFNMPTIERPVYVIENKQQDYNLNSGSGMCFIAGIETANGNLFNLGVQVFAEIWSILAITDFDRWDESEDILSIDLQEYAIRQAMIYCVNTIQHISLKQSLQIQLDAYKDIVIQNYMMLKDQPILELPSQEGI